jgi:small-conductance mechanosensitive channel
VRPGRLATALAVLYAVVDAGVIIAPAVAVRATGARVGIEGEYDADLLVASAIIGVVHGVIAFRRLVDEERATERAVDVWLASIDALVVLAFCSTFLITAVLLGFTDVHALLAQRGAPVVLLWAGVAVVAVVLAELTGRWVYRWLEPKHPVHPHHLRGDEEGPEAGDAEDGEPTFAISPLPPPA